MIPIVEVRQEIADVIQQLKADWEASPGGWPLTVEPDNRNTVDTNTYEKPFLQYSVRFKDGEQLDLGAKPRTEQLGQILFAVVTRDGEGTLDAASLLAFCSTYFHLKDLAIIRCHAFELCGEKAFKEWYYQSGLVNFWFNW